MNAQCFVDERNAILNPADVVEGNRQHRPQQSKCDPTKGFRGRYTDDSLDDYVKLKEQERGGHVLPGKDPALNSRSRAPSFAEQEAMLKELAQSRQNKPKP